MIKTSPEPEFKHCDDYIQDFSSPGPLRWFLLIHRMPAHGARARVGADAVLINIGWNVQVLAREPDQHWLECSSTSTWLTNSV